MFKIFGNKGRRSSSSTEREFSHVVEIAAPPRAGSASDSTPCTPSTLLATLKRVLDEVVEKAVETVFVGIFSDPANGGGFCGSVRRQAGLTTSVENRSREYRLPTRHCLIIV
jgi:hypothetical protein